MEAENCNTNKDLEWKLCSTLEENRETKEFQCAKEKLFNEFLTFLEEEYLNFIDEKYAVNLERIHRYGSSVMGCALRNSDLDMTIIAGQCCFSETLANCLNNCLHQSEFGRFHDSFVAKGRFASTLVVEQRYVPKRTRYNPFPKELRLKLEVSGNYMNGVWFTHMMRRFLLIDERAVKLVKLIKIWFAKFSHNKGHGSLVNRENTLSKCGVLLLVVFYLQQTGILPSYQSLKHIELMHDLTDEMTLTYDRCIMNKIKQQRKTKRACNASTKILLKDMLIGFFEFYGFRCRSRAYQMSVEKGKFVKVNTHHLFLNIEDPIINKRPFTIQNDARFSLVYHMRSAYFNLKRGNINGLV